MTSSSARHHIRALRLAALVSTLALLGACGGGSDADTSESQRRAGDLDLATSDVGRLRAQALTGANLPDAPAGLQGNVICTNQRIGAVTLDNLVVAANSACQLVGTTLTGSLEVLQGASLEAMGIRSNGSVQGEGAAMVYLAGNSRVSGAVQVRDGGSAHIADSLVSGDLQIEGLTGPVVASGNRVSGSLQVHGNLGGLALRDNAIAGNLQCSENLPMPQFSGNSAAAADGQCAGGAQGGTGAGGSTGSGGGSTPIPLAGNVTCEGLQIGDVLLDSVIVPAGASCNLSGTRLTGQLQVGAGAQLVADSIRVAGGLVADGAASLSVGGASTIGGNLQVSGGGATSVVGASVRGDLQIDAMMGPVTASGNQVSGNLQAHANRGGLVLLGNTVRGSMQCKDNMPLPSGSGNTAAAKQDQCLGL